MKKEYKVLNHGFIKLVDVMGTDSSIVQSARVSFDKGTKTPDLDSRLIKYLLKHNHTTPFEMCEVKFHVKLPIFIARQWLRHRTANVNEISARYVECTEEFYVPELKHINTQSRSSKQCRSEEVFNESTGTGIKAIIQSQNQECFNTYQQLIQSGVARELARVVLPVATYTQIYWKLDLHNILKFIQLRIAGNAQLEMRLYAEAMAKIISELFPVTWSHFKTEVMGDSECV